MKIHTDTLTLADLYGAVEEIPGVTLGMAIPRGSRKRAKGYDVALRGHGLRHKRRPANNAIDGYAATYDDWGWWLALLFDKDPEMQAGPHKGREHFEETTRWKYLADEAQQALSALKEEIAA